MGNTLNAPDLSQLIQTMEKITIAAKIVETIEIRIIGMMTSFNDTKKWVFQASGQLLAPA
ncbi:MAG: hypothetical protein ACJAX5_002596 [Patiriisocius sp.]|jgi:hypothetical protein